jgi:hypothetical protein
VPFVECVDTVVLAQSKPRGQARGRRSGNFGSCNKTSPALLPRLPLAPNPRFGSCAPAWGSGDHGSSFCFLPPPSQCVQINEDGADYHRSVALLVALATLTSNILSSLLFSQLPDDPYHLAANFGWYLHFANILSVFGFIGAVRVCSSLRPPLSSSHIIRASERASSYEKGQS